MKLGTCRFHVDFSFHVAELKSVVWSALVLRKRLARTRSAIADLWVDEFSFDCTFHENGESDHKSFSSRQTLFALKPWGSKTSLFGTLKSNFCLFLKRLQSIRWFLKSWRMANFVKYFEWKGRKSVSRSTLMTLLCTLQVYWNSIYQATSCPRKQTWNI